MGARSLCLSHNCCAISAQSLSDYNVIAAKILCISFPIASHSLPKGSQRDPFGIAKASQRGHQRNHCAITARSLRKRRAIAAESQRKRSGIAEGSPRNRCAIAGESLHNHCEIAAQSSRNRRGIEAESLRNRCGILAQSQ
jgi:hypothetical protein